MTFSKPSGITRRRLIALLLIIALLFVAMSVRLGYIQIVEAKELQERAMSQWTRNLTISASRGDITDRNGNVLARSATAWTVVITQREIKQSQAEANAQKLAEVLEMDAAEILGKFTDDAVDQHIIKRKIRQETREAVAALRINGVHLVEDSIRAYPMGSLASQVVGFVDIDGRGQIGVEQTFDPYLRGANGKLVTETDLHRREMPGGTEEYVAPENGKNVVLTIDYVIQSFAEKAAREAMEVNQAQKVWVAVMDVDTGEILAMVNKPDFDLNAPPRNDMELLNQVTRNGIVTDAYEPGSTFKILTTAAALEAGITGPEATYTCTGSYTLAGGDRVRCWRTGLPHGHQTLTQAVMNSCNPVFTNLALSMGRDTFYDYLGNFGLGQQTGVQIRGETAGQMISLKYVKDVDLARVGFGQSISVTPLQLISACSAVVNGGNLMKPQIIREISDGEGNVLQSFAPETISHPISPETSAQMRAILEEVVRDGGGRNAYIPGYRVGGKTGTAQKYDDSGRIMRDTHISSFIGFAPMDDPQIAVLFIVDEPGIRPDYGSTVAAPFARQILQESLQYLGVQPRYAEGEEALAGQMAAVPDLFGMTAEEAAQRLDDVGLRYLADGAVSASVAEQRPAPGTMVPAQSIVFLYTEAADAIPGEGEDEALYVPDVSGMSVVQANRTLRHMGLKMRIEGSGLAASQEPAAGTTAQSGGTVTVTFEPPG